MLVFGMLAQPAKVTSACERLCDAINEMTETVQDRGEATLRMSAPNQQRDIEHLCGYVRGLNRGRGMGFVIQRKRINQTFVLSLAAKVLSVMSICFPMFLSLTRVEDKEDALLDLDTELLNLTCNTACGGL